MASQHQPRNSNRNPGFDKTEHGEVEIEEEVDIVEAEDEASRAECNLVLIIRLRYSVLFAIKRDTSRATALLFLPSLYAPTAKQKDTLARTAKCVSAPIVGSDTITSAKRKDPNITLVGDVKQVGIYLEDKNSKHFTRYKKLC